MTSLRQRLGIPRLGFQRKKVSADAKAAVVLGVGSVPDGRASGLLACGCRKFGRGWSGGMSVLVDESVTSGRFHDEARPVVDGAAHVVNTVRMDGAALASIDTSLAKARTAVYFGAATSNLERNL